MGVIYACLCRGGHLYVAIAMEVVSFLYTTIVMVVTACLFFFLSEILICMFLSVSDVYMSLVVFELYPHVLDMDI